MAKEGTPKRDGSGGGVRANRGRGGCPTTRTSGLGRISGGGGGGKAIRRPSR